MIIQHTLRVFIGEVYFFVCTYYLPYGVAVIDRSCPEVANQGEDDAPGDGEDGTVSDRGSQQQPAQRVDDGCEGLVLSEPAHPS